MRVKVRRAAPDFGINWGHPESGHAVHFVLDVAGSHPPLRDEDALVEPRITRVASLEPGRSAEILVAVTGARTLRERVSDLLVHFEQSGVMHIQRGAVVGEELGAHVEARVSIRSDPEPVAATG